MADVSLLDAHDSGAARSSSSCIPRRSPPRRCSLRSSASGTFGSLSARSVSTIGEFRNGRTLCRMPTFTSIEPSAMSSRFKCLTRGRRRGRLLAAFPSDFFGSAFWAPLDYHRLCTASVRPCRVARYRMPSLRAARACRRALCHRSISDGITPSGSVGSGNDPGHQDSPVRVC